VTTGTAALGAPLLSGAQTLPLILVRRFNKPLVHCTVSCFRCSASTNHYYTALFPVSGVPLRQTITTLHCFLFLVRRFNKPLLHCTVSGAPLQQTVITLHCFSFPVFRFNKPLLHCTVSGAPLQQTTTTLHCFPFPVFRFVKPLLHCTVSCFRCAASTNHYYTALFTVSGAPLQQTITTLQYIKHRQYKTFSQKLELKLCLIN
jgi:hypothetical protein